MLIYINNFSYLLFYNFFCFVHDFVRSAVAVFNIANVEIISHIAEVPRVNFGCEIVRKKLCSDLLYRKKEEYKSMVTYGKGGPRFKDGEKDDRMHGLGHDE